MVFITSVLYYDWLHLHLYFHEVVCLWKLDAGIECNDEAVLPLMSPIASLESLAKHDFTAIAAANYYSALTSAHPLLILHRWSLTVVRLRP